MELLPVVRGLHLGATLLLAGAPAFELLILRRHDGGSCAAAVASVRRALRLIGAAALVVALATWIAWLAILAVAMSGLPAAQALSAGVLRIVVTRTSFGHVWTIRLVLLALLSAQLVLSRAAAGSASSVGLWLNIAASAGLACSLAWTGHALGPHPAHLASDAIHLAAAAAWIGMIPPLWLIVRRAPADRDWSRLAVAAADRFFWPGLTAVGALAISGVANAAWLVDSLADLFTTRYGLLLISKTGLFLLMVLLAGINRSLTRRLRRLGVSDADRTLRTLGKTMGVELACGAAVIAVVAVLGVTPPPAHGHRLHQHPSANT